MKNYAEKEITKKEKILVSIECDQCRKSIDESSSDHYFEATTHHRDWGNDSIDSYQYKDFCSYTCLSIDMKRYFEKANGSEEYEIERVRKARG